MRLPSPARIPYHLALRWGWLRRRLYRRRLARVAARPLPASPELPAAYHAFSGTGDLAEQVASLRSFLRHAGTPSAIVVVGDGTHRPEHRAILQSIHPRVQVVPWTEFIRPGLPRPVLEYAAVHPLGKKLAVLMSLPTAGPLVFSDSDILYFPAAADLRQRLRGESRAPEFLVDSYPSVDPRLVRGEAEKHPPVNSGFALLHRPLDWSVAGERLAAAAGPARHFTEQTAFHLAMRASGGVPLPRTAYVFESDDQWSCFDRHLGPGVALRHYFTSLRYKMWLGVRRGD